MTGLRLSIDDNGISVALVACWRREGTVKCCAILLDRRRGRFMRRSWRGASREPRLDAVERGIQRTARNWVNHKVRGLGVDQSLVCVRSPMPGGEEALHRAAREAPELLSELARRYPELLDTCIRAYEAVER